MRLLKLRLWCGNGEISLWTGVNLWSICVPYVNCAEIWLLTWPNFYHITWLRVNPAHPQENERVKWRESDLEVINRILAFCPRWKFSTMKTIHLRERKASKEFAPTLQTEPHVMILWRRTYVIHYFCLHKENLVYDVGSDIGRSVQTGDRCCSPAQSQLSSTCSGWGAFTRQQCPHTKYFYFYDRPWVDRMDAGTQTPCSLIFSPPGP